MSDRCRRGKLTLDHIDAGAVTAFLAGCKKAGATASRPQPALAADQLVLHVGCRPRIRPDGLLFPVTEDEDVAVIDGEDGRAQFGPAAGCWRGRGVRGGAVVVSLS